MTVKTKTISLPSMVRELSFVPKTFNKEARTVDLCWTTGARVLRGYWEQYFEELEVSDKAIDMTRLNAGAPLLAAHNQYGLDGVIGVVERAWIKDGEGWATVRFSEREEVAPFVKDVQDGIIRNVSVGYEILKMELVEESAGEVPVYRATSWCPFELSLVPVGADAGAGVRSKEKVNVCQVLERAAIQPNGGKMDKVENEVKQPAQPAVDVDAIRKEERSKEKTRCADIKRAVRAAKLDDSFADELISADLTVDQAREKIIAKWEEKSAQPEIRSQAPAVEVDSGKREVEIREAAENALMHRAFPGKVQLSSGGREFRGMVLADFARYCLEQRGVNTRGMTRVEIAKRAFEGTSDLPNVLANVANKSLRQGYESGMQTFKPWTKQGTAPDFKQISRMQLSDFPSLEKVNASGEIKRGFVSDGKEVYSLSTYAVILGLNRQTIINDDMDAFTKLPAQSGKSVADLESDIVWGILTANAALADGVALFHATHKNLGTAAALAVDPLGEGRALMKKQKNMKNRPINVRPQFLLVPAALETKAEQLVGPIQAAEAGKVNPFTGKLQVIAESRLDDASATAWYLACDPYAVDTIEYSYLEGQEGAYIETRNGFDVDGMELKIRHDFAAKALDYRGLVKNAGL